MLSVYEFDARLAVWPMALTAKASPGVPPTFRWLPRYNFAVGAQGWC